MQLVMPGFEESVREMGELAARALAEKPPPKLGTHGGITLEVLAEHGPLAAHEVAAFCRLTSREVGKRLPELRACRLIQPAVDAKGKRLTRVSPQGRRSGVWERA